MRLFRRQSLDRYGINVGDVDVELMDKQNPLGFVLKYVSTVCDVSTFKELRAARCAFKTHNDARAYMMPLGFTGRTFRKWKERPADIPSNPNQVYQGNGWVSWADFLSTNNLSNRDKRFKTLDEAKAFLKPFEFSQAAFRKWKERPADIPSNPNVSYRNQGWVSWGDFFGTNTPAHKDKPFKTHDEAKAFLKPFGFIHKGFREWKERPADIPSNPNAVYKNKGWVSWGDFLGTGNPHGFQRDNHKGMAKATANK